MRIQFLCVFIFLHSIVIANETKNNFLLEHYSLRNSSFGLGYQKDNQSNQMLQGWIQSGKQIRPNLDINFLLRAVSFKERIQEKYSRIDNWNNPQSRHDQFLLGSIGIKYNSISFYGNIQSANPTTKGIAIGINIFQEKTIFFFYKENIKENTKNYALSVVSGKSLGLGISVGKDYYAERSEWSGSIALSFQIESLQAGVTYLSASEKEENSFFVAKILKEDTNSIFDQELNPYEEEKDLEKEKRNKEWEAKKFTKKEKIIYEIKLEELLKFKIPLVIAIRIARASRSKEDYLELLKKLPPELVRKCNKIQYDKSKAKP